jgi:hypothetical protein
MQHPASLCHNKPHPQQKAAETSCAAGSKRKRDATEAAPKPPREKKEAQANGLGLLERWPQELRCALVWQTVSAKVVALSISERHFRASSPPSPASGASRGDVLATMLAAIQQKLGSSARRSGKDQPLVNRGKEEEKEKKEEEDDHEEEDHEEEDQEELEVMCLVQTLAQFASLSRDWSRFVLSVPWGRHYPLYRFRPFSFSICPLSLAMSFPTVFSVSRLQEEQRLEESDSLRSLRRRLALRFRNPRHYPAKSRLLFSNEFRSVQSLFPTKRTTRRLFAQPNDPLGDYHEEKEDEKDEQESEQEEDDEKEEDDDDDGPKLILVPLRVPFLFFPSTPLSTTSIDAENGDVESSSSRCTSVTLAYKFSPSSSFSSFSTFSSFTSDTSNSSSSTASSLTSIAAAGSSAPSSKMRFLVGVCSRRAVQTCSSFQSPPFLYQAEAVPGGAAYVVDILGSEPCNPQHAADSVFTATYSGQLLHSRKYVSLKTRPAASPSSSFFRGATGGGGGGGGAGSERETSAGSRSCSPKPINRTLADDYFAMHSSHERRQQVQYVRLELDASAQGFTVSCGPTPDPKTHSWFCGPVALPRRENGADSCWYPCVMLRPDQRAPISVIVLDRHDAAM